MNKIIITLCFLILTSVSFGQKISEKKLQKKINQISTLKNSFVGIHFVSIKNKKVIASLNSENYMTPASNTKLLTFLGAIQSFDKLPALEYAVENDSIYHFRSTGYPLLFHPFYNDKVLEDFFKSKKLLKYHLPLQLIKPQGAGWSWDDYNYYYASEKSTFPIYGNAIQAVYNKKGVKLKPDFEIRESNIIGNLIRDRFTNSFKYNLKNWRINDTLYRPFRTSDNLFVKLLSKELGVNVNIGYNNEKLKWNQLFTKNEKNLYKGLLQDSDNGIAEALLLMISKKQKNVFDTKIAIEGLNERWKTWLPDKLEWVDGSGVSRYNMFTPKTIVAVLEKIYETLEWNEIKEIFPKSGESGTLTAYRDLKNVYAKTGTLRHNHNLSGYLISDSGEKYIFSFMVNHFTSESDDVKKGISDLLNWIKKKLG